MDLIDGGKAKKELLEAYNNGGFASEEQRLSIVSRIEAHRYVLSRDHQSQKQRESEPEFQAISAQLEQISKEDVSQAEHLLRDGQLMAQRFQTATRRSQIQEIMDATQNSLDFERRIRDYGLLTAEGQQLLNIKDPYQMIAAVNNLPDLSGKAADDLVADMQNKQATKMDTVTAEQFWKRMLAEMGPNQFDPALMEADFSRLIIQQVYDDGYRTTQPLLTALGYEKKKDLHVGSMEDAELMEQIRGHVKLAAKVTELGQITNPMAVVKALAAQDNTEKINELVAEVNASRKHEEISKEEELLKRLQKQADELNGVHKGVEPKPEKQLENSQPSVSIMS